MAAWGSGPAIPALGMSQTKDVLLKHLNMAPETYSLMAREVDQVHQWLVSDHRHLKKNGRRNPPYDFNDFTERSKDDAMDRTAQSGDAQTSYYWNLATPGAGDCPNWIARWFLYHKFRYRDGRKKNSKDDDRKHHHRHHQSSGSSSKRSHHRDIDETRDRGAYGHTQTSYYTSASMTDDTGICGYDYSQTSTNEAQHPTAAYSYQASYDTSHHASYQPASSTSAYTEVGQASARRSNTYWDPVRDV